MRWDSEDSGVKRTYHVLPCSLDVLRKPRGRGVEAGKEFCTQFFRKNYVHIEKDKHGHLLGTLPGGYKPDVEELSTYEKAGLENTATKCIGCGRRDLDHKLLKSTDHDLSGKLRLRCKNCSYCDTFIRVDVPDNDVCEDCGCKASLHQDNPDDPIPRPRKGLRATRSSGVTDVKASPEASADAGGAGRPNASYKPGESYRAIGTIMRSGESMQSTKVSRLSPGTLLTVLELGSGPTGKRVLVRTVTNQEGWISVVSDAGVTLLEPLDPQPGKQVAARGEHRAEAEDVMVPGMPLLGGNISDFLGQWSSIGDVPEASDEAGGESITDILHRLDSGWLQFAMEEPVPEPSVEPTDPEPAPWARGTSSPDEMGEQPLESLEEILRRLGLEEEMEQGLAVEADAASKDHREEEQEVEPSRVPGQVEEEWARKRRDEEELAQRQWEQDRERGAQEEHKQHEEVRARRQREEADAERQRQEEAERQRQEEEAERQRQEEAKALRQRRRQDEEAEAERQREAEARRRWEEAEAERQREEEEAAVRRRLEAMDAERRRREEEEAREAEYRRQQEEAEAHRRQLEADAEAWRRKEEEARWQEEEARRRQEEEDKALQRLEEARRQEEEARRRQEEEDKALQRLEEEEAALKRAEEEAAQQQQQQEDDWWGMEEEDAAWHGSTEPEESPLACAARRRDLFQVQALLRDKANPNETNNVGETPLLQAAACGDLNVTALLLGYSADPAKRAPQGVTDVDAGLSPEVRLLMKIFEDKKLATEQQRKLLRSLDPGAHAQARNCLRLGSKALAYLKNTLSPAASLVASGTVLEFDPTENHRVALHMADPVRPLLVLNPLGQAATATVVMLHGLFQSGRMLERLARDLARNLPHVQFLAPTARTQGCYFGLGPAWFGVEDQYQNLEDMGQEIEELLAKQKPAAASCPERVVLLGFSQGGTLAAFTALKGPKRFAGLMIFATQALSPEYFPEVLLGAEGLDVLQSHGDSDHMIPGSVARIGGECLRQSGCHVHFSLHSDVGHTISAAMVTEARAWLEQRLADGASLRPSAAEEAKGSPVPVAFDIGADEEEASKEDGGSDLDDIVGFAKSALPVDRCDFETPQTQIPTSNGLSSDDETFDDLDAMYDFTDFNRASLSKELDEEAGAEQQVQQSTADVEVLGDTSTTPDPDVTLGMGVTDEDWELMEAMDDIMDTDAPPEVEVMLEHERTGDTMLITVASTANMLDLKEAVALRFGLGQTSGVQFLRKTGPCRTLLQAYNDNTPLGRRRRLLLQGVDLSPEAVKAANRAEEACGAGASPLILAACQGDVEEVKCLLRQKVDPNMRDAMGETALFKAARSAHVDSVAVLLLGKADPAVSSANGVFAADLQPGSPVGPLLWLALNAKVSAQDQRTAFESLEECTRFLIAKLLKQGGIRLAVRDVLSDTEWEAACA